MHDRSSPRGPAWPALAAHAALSLAAWAAVLAFTNWVLEAILALP